MSNLVLVRALDRQRFYTVGTGQPFAPVDAAADPNSPGAASDGAASFDASAIGWYTYLYGDNSAGNEMIKKMNPEMTDELLRYSVAKMKEYGIVDSGDTLKDGIGAMSDERVTNVFQKMVKAGVVKADIDYRKSYTLRFVNKGVGLELRPKGLK